MISTPIITVPATQYISTGIASAVVSAPRVTTTVVGRSTLTGVVLGQDSGTFLRKKGFGFDCFYPGEIVSMARSDGRRTIGQVISVSPSVISVDMGGGAKKDVAAAEIPHKISKLLGLYYLAA